MHRRRNEEPNELDPLNPDEGDSKSSKNRGKHRNKPYSRNKPNINANSNNDVSIKMPIGKEVATAGKMAGGTIATSIAVGVLAGVTSSIEERGKKRGYTLPNSEFIGPGNEINIGAASNKGEQIAKVHDFEYGRIKEARYSSKSDHLQAVQKADSTAIEEFGSEGDWNSWIGKQGLKVKSPVEKTLGQAIYPSYTGDESQPAPTPSNPNSPEDTEAPPSPEHEQPPPTPTTSPMDVSSASEKRPATDAAEGERTPKAAKGPEEHVFPGSASEGGNTGVVTVPLPFSLQAHGRMTFRKIHRMFCYGLLSKVFEKRAGDVAHAATNYYLFTGLMEIPWDRTMFYLNPSEFDCLPRGAYCTEMRLKVNYRNTRTAFETAASASNLATMNQSDNVMYAVGFNQLYEGMNLKVKTGTAGKPWDVAEIDAIPDTQYAELLNDFYGLKEDNANFVNNRPLHTMAEPMFNNSFYCLYSNNISKDKFGWPSYCENLHVKDSNSIAGSNIISMIYNPKCGILKDTVYPKVNTQPGLKNLQGIDKVTFNVPFGANYIGAGKKNYVFNVRDEVPANSVSHVKQVPKTNPNVNYTLSSLIDKSQILFREGDFGCKACPSVHVGIKPSVAKNILGELAKTEAYNDVMANFEISAEMDVEFIIETHFPHAPKVNCLAGDSYYNLPGNLATGHSMWNGLYKEL